MNDFHLIHKFESTGQIWAVDGIDTSKPDAHDIMSIAECFARMGCIVKIPRPVHFKSNLYNEYFGGLKGTKYEKKCPDLCIDGKYYEYESYVRPWNKRKLSNMLSDGLRQSDRIIIDNRDGASIRQIIRAINNRLHVNAPISEVWIYDGDSVFDIYP